MNKYQKPQNNLRDNMALKIHSNAVVSDPGSLQHAAAAAMRGTSTTAFQAVQFNLMQAAR